MKLAALFTMVGLNVDQIRAATAGASRPVIPRVVVTPESNRPTCLVCGRPVGKWSCWPGPSVRDSRR
jgi:hypothetical protein